MHGWQSCELHQARRQEAAAKAQEEAIIKRQEPRKKQRTEDWDRLILHMHNTKEVLETSHCEMCLCVCLCANVQLG